MRVLLIGDGIALTTGFAIVQGHVAQALVARGDDVAQIASLDRPPTCRSEPYHQRGVTPFFPSGTDPVGHSVLLETLRAWQPERIFVNADPGRLYEWITRLRAVTAVPVVAYTPIEGKPINHWFIEALTAAGVRPVLYTAGTADEVERTCGKRLPWANHGVDRGIWHPLDPDDRDNVRAALGWTDRFVCAYVARNAARKAQDVLIEAWQEVQRTTPDALLYLHCRPFDGYELQGWDLTWMAEQAGVEVAFPGTGTATKGPATERLARVVASSDLVLHAAQVEGFGLPLIEAMAAGVPVVHVEDDWVMQEVTAGAALATIEPYQRRPWFTGALLSLTLPEQWARMVHWARNHPDERSAAAERGIIRAAAFDWQTMTDALLAEIDAEEPALEAPAPA